MNRAPRRGAPSISMTVRTRLIWMLLFSAICAVLPAALVVKNFWRSWEHLQAELHGIPVMQSQLKTVRDIQVHRGLTASWLDGAEDKAVARQEVAKQVDQKIRMVSQAQANAAHVREGRDAWQAVTSRWQALEREVSGRTLNTGKSFDLHTLLIDETLRAMALEREEAGMAFDPDPGLNRMATVSLQRVPALIELFGQLRALGTALVLKGEKAPAQDRVRVQLIYAQAAREAVNLNGELQRAAQGVSEESRTELNKARQALQSRVDVALKLVQERTAVDSTNRDSASYFTAITQVIDSLYETSDQITGVYARELADHKNGLRSTLVMVALGMGILFVLSLWLSFHTIRWLGHQLGAEPGDLANVSTSIAQGHLGAQAQADQAEAVPGSVMASMQQMRESLVALVSEVHHGVQNVTTASTEIAHGNRDLSQRTELQASSLQKTASSMHELTATVRQTADNANQANLLAKQARESAERGGEVVSNVVTTMQNIQNSSRHIEEITGVIDSIAFQTNILALNAAVEAARAGEQGRGFAVVAGEVRTLAQRSAEAARQIKTLITDSVEKIEAGGELVTHAGKTMAEVVGNVRRVSELIAEITNSAAEQSQGIEEVSLAVVTLDTGTQQNAALVEQSAAAAESLKQQAIRLSDAVAVFTL